MEFWATFVTFCYETPFYFSQSEGDLGLTATGTAVQSSTLGSPNRKPKGQLVRGKLLPYNSGIAYSNPDLSTEPIMAAGISLCLPGDFRWQRMCGVALVSLSERNWVQLGQNKCWSFSWARRSFKEEFYRPAQLEPVLKEYTHPCQNWNCLMIIEVNL